MHLKVIAKMNLKYITKQAAPYLAGVLGVPEHPRNLGVQERAKPDFCFLEFAITASTFGFEKLTTALFSEIPSKVVIL